MNKARLKQYTRIDWNRVVQTLTLHNQGWTFDKIAKQFGVSRQRIYQIYKEFSNKTAQELQEYKEVCERKQC